MEMWQKWVVWMCVVLGGCSYKSYTREPVPREALCRSISRDLNLVRASTLGIDRPPLTESNRLVQEYQRNRCSDFEEH